jgi:acyl dehydratase
MSAQDLLGRKMPESVIIVERGPVARFAEAVHATSPIYASATAAEAAGFEAVPVPPTFPFVAGYWGALAEDQPPPDPEAADLGSVLADLRKDGGLLLHGEQEFRYHAPVLVGMRLHSSGVVEDVTVKEGKGGVTMTVVKVRTDLTDDAGAPVVTQIMSFLLRMAPKA